MKQQNFANRQTNQQQTEVLRSENSSLSNPYEIVQDSTDESQI